MNNTFSFVTRWLRSLVHPLSLLHSHSLVYFIYLCCVWFLFGIFCCCCLSFSCLHFYQYYSWLFFNFSVRVRRVNPIESRLNNNRDFIDDKNLFVVSFFFHFCGFVSHCLSTCVWLLIFASKKHKKIFFDRHCIFALFIKSILVFFFMFP